MKLIKTFREPYPPDFTFRCAIKYGFLTGVFVFLFFYLFEPFGVSTAPASIRNILFPGYGIICILLNDALIPKLLPKWFGGQKKISNSVNSKDRFARLASLKRAKTKTSLKWAFQLLKNVQSDEKKSPTQWQVVYNPNKLTIYFKTRYNSRICKLQFKDFSFDCQTIPLVMDLDKKRTKSIQKSFTSYSKEINHKFVKRTFTIYHQNNIVKKIPDIYIDILANYPNSLRCL